MFRTVEACLREAAMKPRAAADDMLTVIAGKVMFVEGLYERLIEGFSFRF